MKVTYGGRFAMNTYTQTYLTYSVQNFTKYINLTLQVCLPYLVSSFVTWAAIPTYRSSIRLARKLTSCLHLFNSFHLLASPFLSPSPLSCGFAHLSHPPSLLSLPINQPNSHASIPHTHPVDSSFLDMYMYM